MLKVAPTSRERPSDGHRGQGERPVEAFSPSRRRRSEQTSTARRAVVCRRVPPCSRLLPLRPREISSATVGPVLGGCAAAAGDLSSGWSLASGPCRRCHVHIAVTDCCRPPPSWSSSSTGALSRTVFMPRVFRPNLQHPPPSERLPNCVCSKSSFSAGTTNYKYITETFFQRTINAGNYSSLSNQSKGCKFMPEMYPKIRRSVGLGPPGPAGGAYALTQAP